MTHDNNSEHKRVCKVFKPVRRKNPNLERDEFEDLALDSSIKVIAATEVDSEAFLQRVKSRIENGATSSAEPSSLDVDAPSSEAVETATKTPKPSNAESELSEKAQRFVAFAMTAAAVSVFGFLVWHATYRSTDNSSSVAVESIRTAPVQEEILEAAAPKDPTEVVELAASNIETQNTEPIAKSSVPVTDGASNSHTAEPKAASISWDLHFKFNGTQFASAWIGGRKIKRGIPVQSVESAIRSLCHEVAKRVHFYSPILESRWQGKLTISGPEFRIEEPFNGIDEMCEAGSRLRQSLNELVTSNDTFTDHKLDSSELYSRNFGKLIQNREHLLKNALTVTDGILEPALNLSIFKNSDSVRYKNFKQLTSDDIAQFKPTEENAFPNLPKFQFADLREFQADSPEQLKNELEQATKFDLFNSQWEFKNWIDKVANNSAAGQLETKIQNLGDRTKELKKKLEVARTQFNRKEIQELQQLENTIFQLEKKKKHTSHRPTVEQISPLVSLLSEKPELKGFDLAMGDDCHLCESDADTLQRISDTAGRLLSRFDSFGTRQFTAVDARRRSSVKTVAKAVAYTNNPDQAIGTLDQMLQIEDAGIRIELVKSLGQLDSRTACKLLACYAKYDVESNVRVAATDALRSFPSDMCRKELLAGFRYPWPKVAKHAAEAIVRLNDTESVPTLIKYLKSPDPRMPRKSKSGAFISREMVAINHLRNCMLCHLDSHNPKDKGRGLIPYWNREMPNNYYISRQLELARVRADVTYLRQDFSVLLDVEDHGPWPKSQRFDYVARAKAISHVEAEQLSEKISSESNEYRIAIGKALRLLTQLSPPNDTWEAWSKAVE